MKLICITPQESGASLIYQKPDTALLRNNNAFYLPEFSEHLSARLAYVIKIKKMGKKIAERFAHRYYEEVSVGLNIEALDVLERNKQEQLPWDNAVGFDYSSPIAPFVPKSDTFTLELTAKNQTIQSLNQEDFSVDRVIAEASHTFTLKIGDFIYITLPIEGVKLEIGQYYKVALNEASLLECEIK